jgi:hypothetical protein
MPELLRRPKLHELWIKKLLDSSRISSSRQNCFRFRDLSIDPMSKESANHSEVRPRIIFSLTLAIDLE